MDKIIEACGLTKVFKKKLVAVDDVSFHLEKGEIFGFLGPNGAGKSTTIGMLTTLIKPTKGSAIVSGFNIVKRPYDVRLAIGYVSQDLAVDDALTGYENLKLQAGFYHIPKSERNKRIDEVLKMVELKDRAKDKVETYSGGMRKRLDIACGLIHRPKILFLDEPTLGLDIQTRREIWNFINHLREEIKMTIFMTTHYMDEADSLCDRIAIIDKGVLKITATPSELKKSIGNEIVEFSLSENENGQNEEILSKIKELEFVDELKYDGTKGYRLIVNNGEASLPELFEAVRDSAVRIVSVAFKQPTLDDVFLHYTGREMREDGGSAENVWRTRIALRRARH